MRALGAIYRYLKAFALFWKDFLIGDDWWGALIALAGLGFTYLAVQYGVPAWWIPVVFVTASLAQNLWRVKRRADRSETASHRAATAGQPDLPE
jgi:hypothetical protein